MSELAGFETLSDLKARHAKELGDVKFQGRQRVKAAKAVAGSEQASAIAAAKAENEQAEAEVEYRHAQELEALEDADPDAFAAAEQALVAQRETEKAEGGGSSAGKGSKKKGAKNGGGGDGSASGDASQSNPNSSNSGGGGGEGKKSKAAKKREKELAKEREREARIAAEKAGAGPTPREFESAAIAERIGQGSSSSSSTCSNDGSLPPPFPPLKVHEVLSDGHCLYRSVAHQLLLRGSNKQGETLPPSFQALRRAAAEEMRRHRDDYAPFLDLEPLAQPGDSDEVIYERYCARVAESAEWGGHPELLALSKALQMPLRVHSATQSAEQGPLVVGWEQFGGGGAVKPLELTYHRHFYALGEHYNSTEPV